MTAFSTSDIPASINTLEKLHAWTGTILSELYSNTTAIEATGTASRVATSQPFEITAVNPTEWRLISRVSMKLTGTWRRTGKVWNYAEDLGSASIPTEYKS